MKVKVKIFYKNGIWQRATLNLLKKDLNQLGLFQTVHKKLQCFNPTYILIE